MIKLFKYLKPYKSSVIFTFVFLLIQAAGSIYIPTLTANIINTGLVNRDKTYILKTGILMLLVSLIGSLCALAATFFSSKTSSLFGRDLRIKTFSKSQLFMAKDFDAIGTSSMVTRCTNDINQIQQSVLMTLQFIIPAPFMAISGLILAFSKDKILSILLLGVLLIFAVYSIFIGRKMVPLTQKMQKKMDQINRILLENLSGIRVIRAFNRMESQRKKFNESAEDYAYTAIKLNKVFAVAVPLVMLMMNLTLVLILWIGGERVQSGNLQIGDIMAFIEYSVLILSSLNMGVMTIIYLFRAQACAVRIQEILDFVPETEDGAKIKILEGKIETVEFKDVTFSYLSGEEPILDQISFKLKAGEVTAVIGGTGSGKSTLAGLISRFYDVKKGSILVNGIHVNDISKKTLRERIGLVPQKSLLFSGTVLENIRFGKKNASMDEVIQAAKKAQAHGFISELTDGYESEVYQGGENFSGGQKQRIAIARALVMKPDLYIFDDSFSALDYQTDARVRQDLKKEVKDSIELIIAQRVNTIMGADQIIVLDEGRIVGIGKHNELLKTCSIYNQIVESQM